MRGMPESFAAEKRRQAWVFYEHEAKEIPGSIAAMVVQAGLSKIDGRRRV